MSDFPTDKPHISYSEVRSWKECPYRHKLAYVDKIDTFEESPYLDYGTLLHEQIENFLNGNQFNFSKLESDLRKAWDEKGFDSEEYISKQAAHRKSNGWKPKPHVYIDEWVEWAKNSLEELPSYLDETFPDWKIISAEEQLYEEILGHNIKYKGFIDAILECTGPRGKKEYWILDWKTANSGGWYKDKKRDFLTQAQISSYKMFWRKKKNLGIREIKCGFVLLKRGAKPGKICDLVKVSSGPKMEEKVEKLIGSMITSVKKGLYLKNRDSCLFCEYKNTPHCT